MKVKLTRSEFDYLASADFIPQKLREQLSLAYGISQDERMKPESVKLNISEEMADEIRNLCGEQLQVKGFDRDYEPSREGKLLEALIDKFFAG